MLSFYQSYVEYFSIKWRRCLLRTLELPSAKRRHALFISHNDAIGSHIQAAGAYESETLTAIGLLSRQLGIGDGIALDIGANIGNHTLHMADSFEYVLAFEPSPWLSLILKANVLRNRVTNVRIFDCALGTEEGHAQLSELSDKHTGMMQIFQQSHHFVTAAPKRHSDVQVRRGDDVVLSAGTTTLPVRFIKIDVEGMEVPALRGLSETITRDMPVIAFESRSRQEGLAVIEQLRQYGYTNFHALFASRLRRHAFPTARDLLHLRKRYTIAPIHELENRHYAAIFAWNRTI